MEYSREMNRNSRENGTNMRGGRAANFVVQGSILAAAGILVRIIGMLYRMPLNDIIGKLQKHSVVCCQKRLALTAVQKDGVYRFCRF